MPNSAATSRADLPLLTHRATASRLKVTSNFRRDLISGTLSSFTIWTFHFSPLTGVRQIEATSLGIGREESVNRRAQREQRAEILCAVFAFFWPYWVVLGRTTSGGL